MDADIESFLRDKRSLIQIMGRAARNTEAKVVLYADKMTRSMRAAIDECTRRRKMQEAYNKEHGITPETVKREVTKSIANIQKLIAEASNANKRTKRKEAKAQSIEQAKIRVVELENEMAAAAEKLDFETAISLRAEWQELQKQISK